VLSNNKYQKKAPTSKCKAIAGLGSRNEETTSFLSRNVIFFTFLAHQLAKPSLIK